MAGTCNLSMVACAGGDPTFARYLRSCVNLERPPLASLMGADGLGSRASPIKACGLRRAHRRCEEWHALGSLTDTQRLEMVSRTVEQRPTIDTYTRDIYLQLHGTSTRTSRPPAQPLQGAPSTAMGLTQAHASPHASQPETQARPAPAGMRAMNGVCPVMLA